MAAEVKFYTHMTTGALEEIPSVSGLGFYGATFGSSLGVGNHPTTTWITNAAGSIQGPQVNNTKFLTTTTTSINGAGSVDVRDLPNYLTPLKIHFTDSVSRSIQNAFLYGYDRTTKANQPSNVALYCIDVKHPNTGQLVGNRGGTATTWTSMTGTSSYITLVAGPQESGLGYASPGADDIHDWYIACSASGVTSGGKTFGLYLELEYL